MCGENQETPAQTPWEPGSSPRVRGKLTASDGRPLMSGLIPACAGKTLITIRSSLHPRAHPRVCGENRLALRKEIHQNGSSPRVRGKRSGCVLVVGELGLIPACAGKTVWKSSPLRPLQAHPRVCGENAIVCGVWFRCGGSSPRVRGKRAGEQKAILLLGLIPACAGKTRARTQKLDPNRAHPRVCGENG